MSQPEAQRLSERSYEVVVSQDETTDGDPIFLATNPELPGCMAQGWTVDEAVRNLADARLDYIVSLLQDGLDVPAPHQEQSA
jgi:predicted RNase H-like HicB family nuclease